jgi:hypothetical protein
MSRNNLRIVSNNQVTQVNGFSTAKSINDYRSQYDYGSSFQITTTSLTGPIIVSALLTDIVGPITMTVGSLSTVVEPTSSIFNGQVVGYGGGKYVTSYIDIPTAITSITVTFSSPVKVSKFIVGNYWSPKYNTGYGVQIGYTDSSSSERLQNGDLYTTISPRNKTLQFDLQYMDESDKYRLFDIVKSVGKTKSLFVSVFPEDDDKEKEQMFSMCGKLSSIANISYTMYSIYSSSLQFEEL